MTDAIKRATPVRVVHVAEGQSPAAAMERVGVLSDEEVVIVLTVNARKGLHHDLS